jgi:hypothetical protein
VSSTEAKKFGVEIGVVFAAVALWLWLRKHHPIAAAATGGIGGLLFIGGFVAPSPVLAVKRAWMGLARLLGHINGTLLLTVLFFLVLTPVALLRRPFRKRRGGWEPHEKRAANHFEDPY